MTTLSERELVMEETEYQVMLMALIWLVTPLAMLTYLLYKRALELSTI